MNYIKLKAELDSGHPDTGPYDADNNIAADQLNIKNRIQFHDSAFGDEIFQQTDKDEFGGLTDTKRQLWLAFCGREQINPSADANIDFVKWIFSMGSTTLSNLNTARQEVVSRAVELGLGFIAPGDVENARY